MGDNNYLIWKEIYNTGVPQVDEQHRGLMQLANKIYEASTMRMEQKEEYLKSLLKQAISKTVEHFNYEEQLMERYHYPGTEAHRREHNILRKRLQDEIARISRTNRIDTFRIAQFLKDWMMHHVAIADNDYKIYLLQNGYMDALKNEALTNGGQR